MWVDNGGSVTWTGIEYDGQHRRLKLSNLTTDEREAQEHAAYDDGFKDGEAQGRADAEAEAIEPRAA